MANNANGGGTHFSGQNITIGALSTGDNSTATNHQHARPDPETGPTRQPDLLRVLFVLSNPRGTDRLRLDMEWRVIQEALRLSQRREHIASRTLLAATADDLRRTLLEMPPYQIVHMAGHGGPNGFLLEDAWGRPQMVSEQALAQHFENYRQTLRCVILNACYSPVIGQGIALGIPNVISLSGPLDQQASIEFSRGFYDALGAGTDIERAYREGLSAVRFAGLERDFLALLLRES
ncbi:MAG TPA: CHAT domain-containing protein [Ktedonobacteraceae bacterium]